MRRSRPSRRSACDRCRTYKLRCERSPLQGNSCDRCIRTGATCTTKTTPLDSHESHDDPRHSCYQPASQSAATGNTVSNSINSTHTDSIRLGLGSRISPGQPTSDTNRPGRHHHYPDIADRYNTAADPTFSGQVRHHVNLWNPGYLLTTCISLVANAVLPIRLFRQHSHNAHLS
jgi:hypothetical protein